MGQQYAESIEDYFRLNQIVLALTSEEQHCVLTTTVTSCVLAHHALQKRNQLIAALKSGRFELRKWSRNAPALLDSIPVEHQSNSELLQINNNESIKTLGVYWKPNIDFFQFKINFLLNKAATERSILSTIARLFDPLGFLTPVIIVAK